MSRKSNLPPGEPPSDEEHLQDSASYSRRRVEALDAAAGAAAGAVAGMFAGPIGAAAGAVVGAAIGAVVGHALEQDEVEVAKRDAHLDDIGRDDSVALSRRWASELPPELYTEGVDDSLEPTQEANDSLEPSEIDIVVNDETKSPALDLLARPHASALQTPSLPVIEESEVGEDLQRQLQALDLRATRTGRILVSESPPDVSTDELSPDALDDVLTKAGRRPNTPSS